MTTDKRKGLFFTTGTCRDLGGGICDVSVLTFQEGFLEIKSTAGDAHLHVSRGRARKKWSLTSYRRWSYPSILSGEAYTFGSSMLRPSFVVKVN